MLIREHSGKITWNGRVVTGKFLQRLIVKTALEGITDIRPLIHRVELSGRCSYDEIEKNLGHQKVLNEHEEENLPVHLRGCAFATYLQLGGSKLTVAYRPYAENYKPTCVIRTSDSSPELFFRLVNALSTMTVSSVEYAIDFFCKNQQAVSNLFYLIRRYLFIPRCKDAFLMGGEFEGFCEPRDTNAVYKFKFLGAKHVKIYERGDDRKKRIDNDGQPYWLHNDVDRVRLEFTFRSKGGRLRKIGIGKLSSLMLNPHFESMMFPEDPQFDEIQFKNFMPHSKLPQDHDDYDTRDENGNIESFQVEYFNARSIGIDNLSRYIEDSPKLDPFKNKIRKALREFDKKWSNEVDMLLKKK